MKAYLVTITEVWHQIVRVKARNEHEARDKIRRGLGDYYGEPEYSRTLDPDTWTVEEDDDQED